MTYYEFIAIKAFAQVKPACNYFERDLGYKPKSAEGAPMQLVLHESRHGGDIARGTLTKGTYGVQDEVSAYRAQYSWDGELQYQSADYYNNNPSMGNGFNPTNSVPVTCITDINSVTPAVVNNMGVKKEVKGRSTSNYIWINLYLQQDEKWNSN